MRFGIQGSRLLPCTRVSVERRLVPHIPRHCVRADTPKHIGNRFRIAHRAKERLNPCSRKGRKKVPQVHPQDYALAHVGRDERPYRPSFHETVRRWMWWDLFKDLREDSSLQFL